MIKTIPQLCTRFDNKTRRKLVLDPGEYAYRILGAFVTSWTRFVGATAHTELWSWELRAETGRLLLLKPRYHSSIPRRDPVLFKEIGSESKPS
jgi:hypothetical protein